MKELFLKLIKVSMPLFLRCFGAPIHDVKTGEFLGRIFVFRWKGKLRVVGLPKPVVPCFQPRPDIKYWYQDLGFSRHDAPDFPTVETGKKTASGKIGE